MIELLRETWCRWFHRKYHTQFWEDNSVGYDADWVWCHKCKEWRRL